MKARKLLTTLIAAVAVFTSNLTLANGNLQIPADAMKYLTAEQKRELLHAQSQAQSGQNNPLPPVVNDAFQIKRAKLFITEYNKCLVATRKIAGKAAEQTAMANLGHQKNLDLITQIHKDDIIALHEAGRIHRVRAGAPNPVVTNRSSRLHAGAAYGIVLNNDDKHKIGGRLIDASNAARNHAVERLAYDYAMIQKIASNLGSVEQDLHKLTGLDIDCRQQGLKATRTASSFLN